MKLWEAMLEGAKAGPQLFGIYKDGQGGSCAMGAVDLGTTGDPLRTFKELMLCYPELLGKQGCPDCDAKHFTNGFSRTHHAPEYLYEAVIHLNNDHRWSRQRIAEWLANRELKFSPLAAKDGASGKATVAR